MHSDPVSWCKKQISLLFLMPSTLFLPPRHFLTLFSLSRMSTILPIQESHTLQSAFPSFSRTNDKNNNNKKKPRNLFPNHMFGLQLRSLGQRFILHPPWGQRDSQNRLVFCFFFFFFFTLLFVLIVSGEQRRDSAIHMHVSILPQTPLCPGCQVTLSRVPCAL